MSGLQFPDEIRHRPSIHQLCFGRHMVNKVKIDESVTAYPLKFIAFEKDQDLINLVANSVVMGVINPGLLKTQK